jgi:hypothetical protein
MLLYSYFLFFFFLCKLYRETAYIIVTTITLVTQVMCILRTISNILKRERINYVNIRKTLAFPSVPMSFF